MSARTDESAPMRVFWAYADDGAPELRLGFPDERSPMRLRANGQIERVFYSDPCPDGPINVFGEHRDSVIFDARGVVALLEAAGFVCLAPGEPPKRKLAHKIPHPEVGEVVRVLEDDLKVAVEPGSYATINGIVGRVVAVRECRVPALDLDSDYDLDERLEEIAVDNPHEDEFGVWDDRFIEISPLAKAKFEAVWRNFAAHYLKNRHHIIVAGNGPALPPAGESQAHLATAEVRPDVSIVESAPEACKVCGGESLTFGYGLAGGGMGAYWICDACGHLHKNPEPTDGE